MMSSHWQGGPPRLGGHLRHLGGRQLSSASDHLHCLSAPCVPFPQVDAGGAATVKVVTNAQNVEEGMKVVFAVSADDLALSSAWWCGRGGGCVWGGGGGMGGGVSSGGHSGVRAPASAEGDANLPLLSTQAYTPGVPSSMFRSRWAAPPAAA